MTYGMFASMLCPERRPSIGMSDEGAWHTGSQAQKEKGIDGREDREKTQETLDDPETQGRA